MRARNATAAAADDDDNEAAREQQELKGPKVKRRGTFLVRQRRISELRKRREWEILQHASHLHAASPKGARQVAGGRRTSNTKGERARPKSRSQRGGPSGVWRRRAIVCRWRAEGQ